MKEAYNFLFYSLYLYFISAETRLSFENFFAMFAYQINLNDQATLKGGYKGLTRRNIKLFGPVIAFVMPFSCQKKKVKKRIYKWVPAAPSFSASFSKSLKLSALFNARPPVTTTRAFPKSGRSLSWDVRFNHLDFPKVSVKNLK